MNGELVLSGYRLFEPVHINLQTITIVVPQDDFRTVPVIFDLIIVFRLVRDVVANHKTTRYAGAATKVIQKNHLA